MSKSDVEKLNKSVASWQKSVEHYRGQLKSDVVMVGLGGILVGTGMIAFVVGAPAEGLIAEVMGGGIAGVGTKELRSDMRSLVEVAGTMAVRQYELDQVEDGQE